MNNVDRPGGGPFPGTRYLTRDDFSGPHDNLGNRRDLAGLRDGESLECGEDSAGSSSATLGREADFLRSFRAAIRDFHRDAQEEKRGAQDEQTEPHVLAVAQQPLWTGLPSPAEAAPAAMEKGSSSAESVVASITETIDRLIRAEMAPRAGVPLNVRIPFSDENRGLAGLRITITRTTMDVVFEHTGSVLSDELVRAAEALAERLMTRFSKKTVRIFDIPAPAEQDPDRETVPVSAPLHLRS